MRISTLQGQYQCIIIDPPWFYRLRSKDKTHRNRIPYQPMRTPEILALPIPDLCDAGGCVLWLWFTNNHMIEAAQCLQRWGFDLKTILTWGKVTKDGTKTHLGVGHWLRNSTEHCALAVRGNVKAFAGQTSTTGGTPTLTNQSTILHSPRREHSRKPPEFFELVEKLCPDMTKLEIFARESRDGWDCWGDQADLFDASDEEILVKAEKVLL